MDNWRVGTQRWEHTRTDWNGSRWTAPDLDAMSREGWELVGVSTGRGDDREWFQTHYWKRPLESPIEPAVGKHRFRTSILYNPEDAASAEHCDHYASLGWELLNGTVAYHPAEGLAFIYFWRQLDQR